MGELGIDQALRPSSILIIGAGVFGLSTAHAILNDPKYDQTCITILDQWTPDLDSKSSTVTPSSIDNSRIIRPDYASKPYARLASLAQHEWRQGWPHTLPTNHLNESRLPINPAVETILNAQPYRESGLLLTCSSQGEGLNPKAAYYLNGSLDNILEMSKYDTSFQDKVEVLATKRGLAKALGTGSCHADRGYINRASGWADAGAAMATLKARTRDIIRTRNHENKAKALFLEGPDAAVQTLTFTNTPSGSEHTVTGATLTSGHTVTATLTILAAGAWSTKLLPHSLSPRIKATGQAIGYIAISSTEAARFSHMPVPLDLSVGLFMFPPIPLNDGSGRFILKIARHGWGYAYTEAVPDSEPHEDDVGHDITTSLPAPGSSSKIGLEATGVLLGYLHKLGVSHAQALHITRTCWYADTATGDWVMDYVPRYGKSLFVATGGSGHGFKFAPVLGGWVVKGIEGWLGDETGVDGELGRMLKESWRWRTEQENQAAWEDEGDGSRGGPKGMHWTEEIAKGADCGVGIPEIV